MLVLPSDVVSLDVGATSMHAIAERTTGERAAPRFRFDREALLKSFGRAPTLALFYSLRCPKKAMAA